MWNVDNMHCIYLFFHHQLMFTPLNPKKCENLFASFSVFQDDLSFLEKPDLSLHSRLAIQLRLAEKQILEKVSASGRDKRLHFQKKLEEGSPLPHFEESDIALLENSDTDAKLPIILRKLEEVDEGDGLQVEEPLLNGEKVGFGTEVVSRDVTLDRMGHTDAPEVNTNRTEDTTKENNE